MLQSDTAATVLNPARPADVRFVSGRRHAVTVSRPVWSPLLVHESAHTLVNAYNLALLSELAYGSAGKKDIDGTDAQEAHVERIVGQAFRTMTAARTRGAAAVSALGSDLVLRQTEPRRGLDADSFVAFHQPETDTQGYAIASGDYALLAFRGTETLKDWLRDFTMTGVDCPWSGGQVHGGFLEGFVSVQEQLDAFLDEQWAPGTPVFLCGHSLGGALATVAATYVRRTRRADVVLYTYGAPRAGDRTWVRSYASDSRFVAHRHVYHLDVVPRVPIPGQELNLGPLGVPLTLVDVDLDTWHHVGQVLLHRHPAVGDAVSYPLTRATGPSRYVIRSGNLGLTLRSALDKAVDAVDRELARAEADARQAIHELDELIPVAHLITDHFIGGYVEVTAHLLLEEVREYLDHGELSEGQRALHQRFRALEAEAEAEAALARRQIGELRQEAFRLRWGVEQRQAMVAVRDRYQRSLIPLVGDDPGLSQEQADDLRRADELDRQADRLQVALDHDLDYLAQLRSQGDAVLMHQGSLAGYEVVEGLRDELARFRSARTGASGSW